MKKFFLLFSILIFFLPQKAGASFAYLPNVLKFTQDFYQESQPIIDNLENTKEGSYIPGVFDSKVINFKNISQKAKEAVKKVKAEEQKKRDEERLRIANIEPIMDGKYIDVDFKTQTLTAFQDRQAVYRFKVSTGAWNYPTPTGMQSIKNKISRAYSKEYNLYMPWWMAINWNGYGIHELPEYPNGYKEGANLLGRAVSHGCIRLGVGPAKAIYDWANIGDPVYVH